VVPFIIFVDVNLPLTSGAPPGEKPWLTDVFQAMENQGEPTAEKPDPYNALIPTNFAYYYGGESTNTEWGFVIPKFAESALADPGILELIMNTVERYRRISVEV